MVSHDSPGQRSYLQSMLRIVQLPSDEAIVLSPMPFASLGRKRPNMHDRAATMVISGMRDEQR